MSGPPGNIQNPQASGCIGGAIFSFCAPDVTGTNEAAVSYSYYLMIGLFPTPTAIWVPSPDNLIGPFEIPYYATLPANTTVTMKITPNGAVHGIGPEYTLTATTLNPAIPQYNITQALSASTSIVGSNAVMAQLSPNQLQSLSTAQLSSLSAAQISTIDSTSLQASSSSVNVVGSNMDPNDVALAGIANSAISQAPVGSTLLTTLSVAASNAVTGASNSTPLQLSIGVTAAAGVTIDSAAIYSNKDGITAVKVSNASVFQSGNNFSIVGNVYGFSIYIIIIQTSTGGTVTIPVENNQAYNDYLHDESGYQNRRENRILTSGFYRGPVDSSTLTRIRSANGVLLGVNGVPGGMQGSRCCP